MQTDIENLIKVKIQTQLGDILVELNQSKAPKTVANFLAYIADGFYNKTIFHRVIAGFMIQAGGFTEEFSLKETKQEIENEAANELQNLRATIAMARTSEPNSASSQFFINLVDNKFLNYTSPTNNGYGYAVFGKVIAGMDIVDKLATVETTSRNGHQDVPKQNLVIEKISTIKESVMKPV